MTGERIVDFQQFDTNNDGLGGQKYWVAEDNTGYQEILVKQGDARGFKSKFLSVSVSPEKTGASNGYVAAGGPGFTGPTDTVGRVAG